MWKDIGLHVSQNLLSQQNGYYGLTAAIFNNIWYQRDHRKSLAIMTGFYDETNTETNSCENPSGFKTRSDQTSEGKWYALRGGIFHGMDLRDSL